MLSPPLSLSRVGISPVIGRKSDVRHSAPVPVVDSRVHRIGIESAETKREKEEEESERERERERNARCSPTICRDAKRVGLALDFLQSTRCVS